MRKTTILATVTIMSWGCGDAEDQVGEVSQTLTTNTIVPTGGTPFDEVILANGTRVFRSRWDNPVLQGRVTIGANRIAIRGPLGGVCPQDFGACTDSWEYNKFDVTLRTIGSVNNSAETPTLSINVWPSAVGIQQGPGFLHWDGHGTRLGRRVTGLPDEALKTAQSFFDDAVLPLAPHGDIVTLQLHPSVKVVPLRVVQLFVSGAGSIAPNGWFSQPEGEVLIDDMWKGAKHINTDPQNSPDDVVTEWTARAGCVDSWCNEQPKFTQPDRIWDQCNVQFRMIDYRACAVAASLFSNLNEPTAGVCDSGNSRKTLIHDALTTCGVPAGSVINVVLLGTLVPDGCADEPAGAWDSNHNNVLLAVNTSPNSPLVLAHELGHALGLGHPTGDPCLPQNLMCVAVGEMNTTLTSTQCTTALTNAGNRQSNWPPNLRP